jgi:hypothetical protein
MLSIALTLLGYVSYRQLPVELLPNAELPALFVSVGLKNKKYQFSTSFFVSLQHIKKHHAN